MSRRRKEWQQAGTPWLVFRDLEGGATWASQFYGDPGDEFALEVALEEEAVKWRKEIGLPARFGFVLQARFARVRSARSEPEAILRAGGEEWAFAPGVVSGDPYPCPDGLAHTWQRGELQLPAGYHDLRSENALQGSYVRRWVCSVCGARRLERLVTLYGGSMSVLLYDYPTPSEVLRAEKGIA